MGRLVMDVTVAAVDLGATSGRVVVGHVGADRVKLEPVNRFANLPVALPGGLHWDLLHLYASALDGLREAASGRELASVAIDSWAVDYGLVSLEGDGEVRGRLAGLPYCYRDGRTETGVASVHARLPHAELYGRNGLQFLPFNTLYQLAAEPASALQGRRMLLVPDLLAFWLTGEMVCERTNASTTGLLDPRTRDWDADLIATLGLPVTLFGELVDPGNRIGTLRPEMAELVGSRLEVLAAPTHDTASAVMAVPMDPTRAAYVSCGTWGLVGVETPAPILTDAAREAGFTNEGGVDGTTRFLHNVMGLWVLTELLRGWGRTAELVSLLDAAASEPAPGALVDVDDPRFLAPGPMEPRLAAWLTERGLPVPASEAGWVRLVVESLADAFARAVTDAARLSGVAVERIHIVGGGSQNRLLCQLTADRSGLPVEAGPVEATALGNVLTQARALGVGGSLAGLRALVAASFERERFSPR